MSTTPNEFVLWLLDKVQSAEAPTLTLNEIIAQALDVATEESAFSLAVGEHEVFTNYIRAGFTEEQAFRILLNDRYARAHGLAMGFGQHGYGSTS